MFNMNSALPALACAPPSFLTSSLLCTPTSTRLCTQAALISSVESCNQCCSTLFAFAQNFLIISIWKANQKLCVLCKTVIFHKSLGQRVTNRRAEGGLQGGNVTSSLLVEWWEMMEEASGGDRRVGACLCIITWFNCHDGKQINEFRSENSNFANGCHAQLTIAPLLPLLHYLERMHSRCGHRSLHMHQNSIRFRCGCEFFGTVS